MKAIAKTTQAFLVATLSLLPPCVMQEAIAGEQVTYSTAINNTINSGWKPLDRNRDWRMRANAENDNSHNRAGNIEFWGRSGIGDNICHFYFARNKQYLDLAVLGGREPSLSSKVLYQKIVSKPEEMNF